MPAGKGYGSPNGAGYARGEWSVKGNPMPVPKKGSALPTSSLATTEPKVQGLMKKQERMESNKGKL
jgi:hypothetical protein